jgi:hypothetical protein
MKPAKTIKILSTLLILLTFNFLLSTSCSAQSATNGLSAIPPRSEIEVVAGQANTQSIKVRNESTETKTITVSVRDFIVTDNQGTPEFIDNFSDDINNRWAASSWIQVSPQASYRLKPGETKSLMVTIIVPENATPGGHYAMILHSPNNEAIISQNTAAIETNVGTLILINVPGKITQNAKVDEFSAPRFLEYGPVNFKTIITNLSDTHIKPLGKIKITNIFGLKTTELQFNNKDFNIFPLTSRIFENVLNKRWLLGRYRATLQSPYGTAGNLITATLVFWVIPWRLLLLISAALLITILLMALFKKPTKQDQAETIDGLEKELEKLKNKYKDKK